MDHIIRNINQNVLLAWGFNYDGAYWIHDNYPFKLQLASSEDGNIFNVLLPMQEGYKPVQIVSNGQLLQIIVQFFGQYLDNKLKQSKFLNQNSQINYIKEVKSKYFSFDPNISLRFQPGPAGTLSLTPNNEYTQTLLTNIECEFKIDLVSELITHSEIVYCSPECISLGYLTELFPNEAIIGVYVKTKNNEWQNYYGPGIIKIEEN